MTDLTHKMQEKTTKEADTEKISKNAMKKKKRWLKIKEMQKDKRLKRKALKKVLNEKQQKEVCLRANADSVFENTSHFSKRERIQKERERLLNILHNSSEIKFHPLQISIDLQFGDKMSDKELSHLASQLRRIYGSNKSNETPVKLSFVNLDETGRTFKICCDKNDGFEKYIVHRTSNSLLEEYSSVMDKLVYLTPDSLNPLEQLERDKIYVIGGLVDDSVQKNVSLKYAMDHKISTARLPIKEHCSKRDNRKSSFKQILTINQVFDILLKFNTCQNWSVALNQGVPKRTGYL